MFLQISRFAKQLPPAGDDHLEPPPLVLRASLA